MIKRCFKCAHPVGEVASYGNKSCFHYVHTHPKGFFVFFYELLFTPEEKEIAQRGKRCPYRGCKCNTPIMGVIVDD